MSDTTRHRRVKTVSFPSFNLVHSELTICELKQVPSHTAGTDEKANFFYSANTKDVGHYSKSADDRTGPDAWTVGWCEFTAEKQVDNELRAQVTATYLFIYIDPAPPAEGHWSNTELMNLVISVGVWPRFRDLVAHMMAQGSTVFPPLPAAPDKIGHTSRRPTSD